MPMISCVAPCGPNEAIPLSPAVMPCGGGICETTSSGGSGTVPPYSPENSYGEGTVVAYNGKYYAANADIPAGTPFTVGTSGATWREINLATSTIPPFSPSKDYVQYEAVDYLGVLYTSIEQHPARPWDPLDWKPLSTSGGVTANIADTQTIDMSGDGSVGAPISAEVKVATALPGNMLVATGSGLFAGIDVNTADSSTVDFSGDGSDTDALTAAVKVSATAGNQITVNGDGLFVAAPSTGLTSVTSSDSTSIDFSGAGTAGSPLTAAVKPSATANNALVLNGTGVYVPAFTASDTPTVDVSGSGTPSSPLQAAAKISATAGNVLVANADGLFVPTPPTGEPLSTTDSATIDFSGAGTSADPLTGAVKRSATAGNALTENADGLYVPTVTPGLSTVATSDSATIDIGGNGTPGSPITTSVKISSTPNNGITQDATGIWAPAGMPSGGAAGAVLRKSSTTNYATEWAQGIRVLTDGATARTIILTDQDQLLLFNNAAAKAVTVPPNSTTAFPIGTTISLFNKGVGLLTVTPGSGVTVLKPSDQSYQLAENNLATLTKTGTNEWILSGGMVPL